MSTITQDAVASFQGLSPEQQSELDKILAWMQRRDPRQEGGDELKWQKPTFKLPEGAEEWFDDNPDDYYVLRGFAGVGKEQPVSTTVQTPTGPRRFGDLQVGDYVLGRSGKATQVLGVFPQGVKQVYRVEFRDGSSTRCGIEHLWATESRKDASKTYVRTLREIIDKGVLFDSGVHRYKVPLCGPAQFETPMPTFDAYVMGVLIGDGYLTGYQVQFSTPDFDMDIVHRVTHRLGSGWDVSGRDTGGCKQYAIIDTLRGGSKSRLRHHIQAVGLDVKSVEKRIPAEYLYAPESARWDLLRGLMDTDGSCIDNRTSFSSLSLGLAQDVRTLVQSLGGTAILHTYDRTAEGKGIEYDVNVKTLECPFFSERKSAGWTASSKNPPSRYITAVVEDGVEEQMCIMVDAEDHLYLTDEFIVTHNTVLVGELIMEASAKDWNIAVTAPTNKAVSILQEKVRAVAKTRVVAATFSSLHSVCGLRMVETDDGELKISSTGYSKFDGVQLLIVDEASMVDTKMLLRSIQNSRGRTLVLFVGDPAQLPPVMEGSLAKVFVLPQGGTMTKIVRQAEGNPLIEASMMIRRKNRIEEIMAAPTLDEQERIMASLGPDDRVQVSDLMDMLPDSMVKRNRLYDLAIGMQRDGRDARIIAYTNRAVLDYNREIHFDLFPESVPLMFATGERVIVQSATKAENIDTGKDVDLVTSEELVIEHVEMGEHHKYPGFTCYVMILRDDLGNFVKVYTPKLTTALNNRLAELFGEVQDMRFAHHRNPRDLALKEKYTQARNAAWLYKNSFADIRHTYSMTTHKSQGSTVDTVLIDLPNLMLMPTTFAFNTALYVAITRPRFEAIIGY